MLRVLKLVESRIARSTGPHRGFYLHGAAGSEGTAVQSKNLDLIERFVDVKPGIQITIGTRIVFGRGK